MPKAWSPEFKEKDCDILQENFLYQGYCPIKKLKFKFRLFEDGWSEEVYRECILRPPAVAVLLYDPRRDALVLIEQIRVGALMEPENISESPWLLEIVAGLIDEGESPENTAIREVEEEAGLKVERLFPICRYLVSPGISSEVIHVFCGIVEAPIGGTFHGLREDGEDIKVHVFKTSEALALLKQGKILSSPTLIALQWFEINRDNADLFQ